MGRDGGQGDVFRRCAKKRVTANDGAGPSVAETERHLMAHKWASFPQGPDHLVRLDVTVAVSVPREQHGLHDVVHLEEHLCPRKSGTLRAKTTREARVCA